MAELEEIFREGRSDRLLIGSQELVVVLEEVRQVQDVAGSAFPGSIPRVLLVEVVDIGVSRPAFHVCQNRCEKDDVVKEVEDACKRLLIGCAFGDSIFLKKLARLCGVIGKNLVDSVDESSRSVILQLRVEVCENTDLEREKACQRTSYVSFSEYLHQSEHRQ